MSVLMVVLFTLICGLFTLTAPAAAQGSRDNRVVEQQVVAYRVLVDEYRAGRTIDPVLKLLEFDRARLDMAITRVVNPNWTHVLAWRNGDRPVRALFAAAAMLHTDAAMLMLQERIETANVHLDFARRLIDAFDSRTEPRGVFGRRWYMAVGLTFSDLGEIDHALRQFDLALERYPDDPSLLLAAAQVNETSAGGHAPLRYFRFGDGLWSARKDRDTVLKTAARLLEHALSIDPHLIEARVRLARIRSLQGRDPETLALLEDVAAAKPEPRISYVVHLFLGRLAERRRELDAAVQHYRSAAALVPDAQTAHMALAQAFDRGGDLAASRAALTRALESTRDEQSDPWWRYLIGAEKPIDDLFAALRSEGRK